MGMYVEVPKEDWCKISDVHFEASGANIRTRDLHNPYSAISLRVHSSPLFTKRLLESILRRP
jgi:hypothetical protein